MASELSKRNNDELFIMLRKYTADEFSETMPRRFIEAAFKKSKAVKTELERRLSSRPEVPADVLAAVQRNYHAPKSTGGCYCDTCLMARFIRSLSQATPEVK